MTDEEAFNILQAAEDMSHKNWMHFRLLYNNKFKEAEHRIKELEAALGDVINAWDFWQSQETRSGFSELFASICEARAALKEKTK